MFDLKKKKSGAKQTMEYFFYKHKYNVVFTIIFKMLLY